MEKEIKCYNVVFETSKKKNKYLAGEANSSDSGYIGRWLRTPSGSRLKIVSIVFYPKTVIDEMPYNLKTLTLGDLRFEEEKKEEEAKSVEMVKDIFRDMGIFL